MRKSLTNAGLGFALAIVTGGQVHAETDTLMPCNLLLVKTGSLSKVVCRGAFPLPSVVANEPTVGGATLTFRDIAAGSESYQLPAAGWKGLGNPAGVTGFKFHDADCPVVLLKTNVVKGVCRVSNTLALPPTGDVLVSLELPMGSPDKRYCGQFGGTVVKSTSAILRKKLSDVPATCSPALPSTTSSTTSTSTSSTSSTTIDCDCCGSTKVEFSGSAASGTCGAVTNSSGTQLLSLTCGGFYVGGGQAQLPQPATLPEGGQTVFDVATCDSGTGAISLAARSAGATGSLANCSEAGCSFGAPVPLHPLAPLTACAVSVIAADASGALNCRSTTGHLTIPVESQIYLSNAAHPCPICDSGTLLCVGGANNGNPCTPGSSALGGDGPTSADCPPGGSPSSTSTFTLDLVTGSATFTSQNGPNNSRVFVGYCRDRLDGNGNPGTLDFEFPPVKCLENLTPLATCSQPYESCEQRSTGAFAPTANGARTITTTGVPIDGCLEDALGHSATLAGVFSISPPNNPDVELFSDLPGPAVVSHAYTVTLVP